MTVKLNAAKIDILHVKGAGKGGWQTAVKIVKGPLIVATGKLYGKYDENQIRTKFLQNPRMLTIAPAFDYMNDETLKALVA